MKIQTFFKRVLFLTLLFLFSSPYANTTYAQERSVEEAEKVIAQRRKKAAKIARKEAKKSQKAYWKRQSKSSKKSIKKNLKRQKKLARKEFTGIATLLQQ